MMDILDKLKSASQFKSMPALVRESIDEASAEIKHLRHRIDTLTRILDMREGEMSDEDYYKASYEARNP